MANVHFFTPRGALCDPAVETQRFTLVPAGVTCASCRAALELREREEEARPAVQPRVIARLGVRSAWDRLLNRA